MGDDGIGIEVAKNIEDFLKEKNIELIIGETDFEYCLSSIEKDDFLFILDAGYYHKKVGDITILPIDSYTSNKKAYTQHSYSFVDLIKLYYKEIKGYILAIEIYNVDYNLEISRELKNNMNKICNEIVNIIRKELKNNKLDYNKFSYYSKEKRTIKENNMKRQREFTLEELKKYDGSNGNPAYVAINGIVYDVSYEPTWGGGTHFGLYSGKDLSNEFLACHKGMLEILNKLPKVGVIK